MHTKKISVRLHLYKAKTYVDETNPILLEYLINGVRKKKVLDRCKKEEWDDKGKRLKPNADRYIQRNNLIRKAYTEAEELVYKVKLGEININNAFSEHLGINLQKAIDLELLRMESENRSGYYDKILAISKQIDTNVLLADIDKKWFDKQIDIFKKLGNINNTIQKKIKLLRGLVGRYLSSGISKEVREVRVPTTKSLKIKLTEDELKKITDLALPKDELITAARDLFLLQIYLRGIRIGDLLQATSSEFENGRFSYKADKTGKEVSIKLIPKAQEIIDIYKDRFPKLFPFFTWQPAKKATTFENERTRLKHKETCTTIVNKHLKIIAGMCGITKPLSSHIARHTFARMAIDKINNPMVTMDLLGHSSLAIHQSYLNDIRKDDELDKAADDIFG